MRLSREARVSLSSFIIATALLATIAGHFQYHENWSAAFGTIIAGDTEDVVLRKLGSPTAREKPDHLYPGYALANCVSPCAERLWYENSVLGLEAWSVSLSDDRRVLSTYHWVSP
ncbi:hypothetical protein HGP17_00730 [Rhizobium sp. P38BS-XIX]|uniref:hypothetical protein n=1 Tax=Rhizobium sp. P38BS-XIX TaxID=2726740 RepID=UPI0014574F07|nr:hypothetical protein [Rhizobium sp. P38BS-XIX]NLR95354.1 hypothetical protein [Rhizobium sp. P38BS-XIX]